MVLILPYYAKRYIYIRLRIYKTLCHFCTADLTERFGIHILALNTRRSNTSYNVFLQESKDNHNWDN